MMEIVPFDGLNYRMISELLDVISWDAYPTWHDAESEALQATRFAFNHDLFRTLKGKPFMLMESTPSLTNWQPISKLKRPGMHKLSYLQAVAHGSDTGHEQTRVFRDVTELGTLLTKLNGVIGTSTPAEIAIIFDWDNRWAVRDAQGPRNMGIHYERTVLEHYAALWQYGVSVDVIGTEDDFSRYKMIAAPMLYLCSESIGQRLEQFVESGGILISTYWSGIVDEHDLCYLGGFPGPLRRTLGIWAEEMEGLHPHECNGLILSEGNRLGLDGVYEAHELCELVHAETAQVLGVYQNDFYAGRPALTCNELGSGCAYYMATRLKSDFLGAFYSKVVNEAGVARVMRTELPEGVTAQLRTDGIDYIFILNFSGMQRQIKLDQALYSNLETGLEESGEIYLEPNGVKLLSRPHEMKV